VESSDIEYIFLSVRKIISPWRTGIDDLTVKFLEKTGNFTVER